MIKINPQDKYVLVITPRPVFQKAQPNDCMTVVSNTRQRVKVFKGNLYLFVI